MVKLNVKAIFLMLIAASLVLGAANAGLTATVEVIDGDAKSGETLSYKVTFYNPEVVPTDISTNIFFGNPEFAPGNALTIPARSFYTVDLNILISDQETRKLGSVEGRTTYQQLLLFDDQGSQLDYIVLLPATLYSPPDALEEMEIRNVTTEPSKIDSREPFDITFNIYNPTELTPRATVSIDSEFDFGVLPELEVVPGEGSYRLSGLTVEPTKGQYPFTLNILIKDKAALDKSLVATGEFNIPGYSLCSVDESVSTSIIGKRYTATVMNDGTDTTTCSVSTKLIGLERTLSTQKTEGYSYETDQISWDLSLTPGASKIVEYNVSYLPIIAIPFVIILIAVAYWYMTRKTEIVKELVDYKRHTGFMDLKLQLHVKNLSNKDLEHVKVYDPLPAFVKEVRDYGTIPGKMTKKEGSRVIKWDISTLKAKEERVFSYKVRTSLEIIGKMNFPSTIISFINEKGETIENTSNVLVVEVE